MPLQMAVAGSLCVSSEAQLTLLLRVTRGTLPVVGLVFALYTLGVLGDGRQELNPRVLAITTVLVGCVFLGEFPRRETGSFLLGRGTARSPTASIA